MSKIQFPHHGLYRKVQYFEATLLAICIVGELLAWKFAPEDLSVPNAPVSLFLLVIFAFLNFFTPVRGNYWDRLCFLFMQIILLTGATEAGFAQFVFPLFTVVMAKACLILDRRGLWITGTAVLCAQLTWASYKIVITKPQLLVHRLTIQQAIDIFCGAFVATYVGNAVMILVGMLTLSLIAEQKSRMETEKLSKELEALATELERSRIAREIHDSLGHTLTTLNIQLDLVKTFADHDPVRSRQALALAKELATQSLNDVRLVVQSIRHADFNLKEAIDALIQNTHDTQLLDVRFVSELPQLPSAIAFQIFRVIQECLTNVLKHANASQVMIQIACKENVVELEFSDNGRGLIEQSADGFGLKGIRERVESMHGSMSINTKPDRGTCTKVIIPLP